MRTLSKMDSTFVFGWVVIESLGENLGKTGEELPDSWMVGRGNIYVSIWKNIYPWKEHCIWFFQTKENRKYHPVIHERNNLWFMLKLPLWYSLFKLKSLITKFMVHHVAWEGHVDHLSCDSFSVFHPSKLSKGSHHFMTL